MHCRAYKGRELFFRETGSGDGAWQGPYWFDIISTAAGVTGANCGAPAAPSGGEIFGGAAGLTFRRRRSRQGGNAACAEDNKYDDGWSAPEPWGTLSGLDLNIHHSC